MKQLIETFVKQYKDFLTLKNTNHKLFSITFLDLIMITFMQIILFLIIGLILKQLNNFYFISLALNVTLMTSFTLYLIKKDIAYRLSNNLNYSLMIGISYDFIRLLYILSTSNLIIYLTIYNPIISISYLIFLLVLSLLSFLGYRFLKSFNHLNTQPKASNATLSVLWLSGFSMLLFYTLGIKDIRIAYLVVFILMMGFVIINQWLNQIIFRRMINRMYVALGVFFMGAFLLIHALVIDEASFNSLYDSEANLGEALLTLSDEDYNPFYYTDGTYLYHDAFDFRVYDEALTLLNVYEKEDESAEYFVIEQVVYKSILSPDQANLPNSEVTRYDLYQEVNGSFIYLDSLVIREEFHDPSEIILFKAYSKLYYTTRFGEGVYGLDGTIASNLSPNVDRIIHNKDNHLVLAKNNRFYISSPLVTGILYDQGMVGYDLNRNTTCITSISNYMTYYPSCLGDEIPRVENYQAMLIDGDDIYTFKAGFYAMNDNTLTHINHDGHELFSSLENFEHIFVIGETVYVTLKSIDTVGEDILFSHTFYEIDLDHLTDFTFNRQAFSITLTLISLWLGFIIVPIDFSNKK
jgi:hypothetical protein